MKLYRENRNIAAVMTFFLLYPTTHWHFNLVDFTIVAMFWYGTWVELRNYINNPCKLEYW